jgi:hypothetical protein
MSTQVVQNFTRKIADKQLIKGLKPVNKTLKECLLDLKHYILVTMNDYLGTETYDNKTTAEWIYKDYPDYNVDKEKYVKVNLFCAYKTFENIVATIETNKGGLKYHNIIKYRDLLYDFLHDINDFIFYIKRKTDPNYFFLTGGKAYSTSSFETFIMAKTFFYSSLYKKNILPYKESQGMVAMAIRQSIEIKTKRVLGIYMIQKTKRNLQDYGFKRLFKFIEDNQTDITYDPIDFEILKTIYGWSCAYIHNGELSYIWQTEWALNYLNTFFKPGISSSSGKTRLSIFGAFKLRNYNSLKTKLDAFVGSNYKILYVKVNNVEAIVETL